MRNKQHELIPITKKGDSQQWVDGRTLHQFLEVGKDFSNWIKDFIADFDFVEGRDFSPNLAKSTGGRNAIEYSITLDMAKELSMLQRNEKGKQARQYFIAAEKQLRNLQTHLLTGYDEVGELLKMCESRLHNGFTWYAAGQLRRLAGKTSSGSYSNILRHKLYQVNTAIKLPSGNQQKWYVRADCVNLILGVRANTFASVAIVKLLNVNSYGNHAQ